MSNPSSGSDSPPEPSPQADLAPAVRPRPGEDAPASARTTGLVSLAIMCSRVLGLIRDQIFAALFPKALRDCFLVAFRTPNMLRDLFAEGALSTAFVTVFSQKQKSEGDASAWALAHKILSLATVFMSGVSVAGVLLAPLIVRLLAGGWADEEWKIPYTVKLAQIMYPFILLVSLSALVMGILNARKVYGVPAMASSFFNIVSIIGGWVLGWILHKAFEAGPEFGQWAMIGFSVGTLLGGLAQLGWQLPALFKCGYRFLWDRHWKDPGVRRILHLMWPAVIAGSAVQVNVLLNTIFASHLPQKDGPVTWLNYSFRLMQLPLGVFGVAVATVTLPVLSRVATEGITPKFGKVLGGGNRLVIFLTLPCAVGLWMLSEPIISLLYERGQFHREETIETASALRWYAVGLVFYACIKVVQPAFTAIDRRFYPMFIALGSIFINAALNTYFVFFLRPAEHGQMYLALTTAVVALVNCVTLYVTLSRLVHGLDTRHLLLTLAKLAVPCLAVAALCWWGNSWVLADEYWRHFGLLKRLLALGAVICAAAGAYFVLAAACRVEEAQQFLGIVKRRVRR
jgi:putative peptidoglycan lipid II flippase